MAIIIPCSFQQIKWNVNDLILYPVEIPAVPASLYRLEFTFHLYQYRPASSYARDVLPEADSFCLVSI